MKDVHGLVRNVNRVVSFKKRNLRMIERLTRLALDRPRTVIAALLLLTVVFALQFPRITIDTDPKHMLPPTSPVRQYNDQMEHDFALYADTIALGILNDRGVLNPGTLTRIAELTRAIQEIPGVAARDVTSFTTIDNVTTEGGVLAVRPPVENVPHSAAAIQSLHQTLLGNPLFVNRIISPDAKATAIFVPLESGANGMAIADRIRALLPRDNGGDRFYLAGDPIARDTFGQQMFRQMGLFSPIAGAVMCAALWLMFRRLSLVMANMGVAMISIVWSMGLLIGLGYPVHIMASMSPIFLMAIATDSVHIVNEFRFRYGETRNRRQSILDTMAAVGIPVFYSDATTAVGFAALATGSIVPVKIFGLAVAFGTLVILLLSFTLVPAVLALMPEKSLLRLARHRATGDASPWLSRLGDFCVRRGKPIVLAGGALLVIAAVGLSRLNVNNNMVHWFKFNSPVRTADRVMNEALGGTSTGYLVVHSPAENAMKDPRMLRDIEGLQREVERDPLVGKTLSVVDYVKRINCVLHDNDPAFDRVPDSAEEVGQYLFLFGMSAKPRDLDNVVDYPYQKANIHIQLKSWNAATMRDVIHRAQAYLAAKPLPAGGVVQPAGIAYFNMVWSDEVLWGMLTSFLTGLALVLLLLIIQLRSIAWGLICFFPLLFTVALIYGLVGWLGKDLDMPVAVLSTLSLGMAIDFAIHFVARFRDHRRRGGDLREALIWTVQRPGKGIFLNAVLFALGFAVMAFADLTPYITVGILMAAIMLLSSLMSVIYLPALIWLFRNSILRKELGHE
jgi:hypothetical protein